MNFIDFHWNSELWFEDNIMDDFLIGTRYEKQYVQSLVTFKNIKPEDIVEIL